MRYAQVTRDVHGMRRLVEALAADLDREGRDRRVLAGRQRGEQAAVQPAGQEHAERHVGDALPRDGLLQQHVQPVDGLGIAYGRTAANLRAPVFQHLGLPPGEAEHRAWA